MSVQATEHLLPTDEPPNRVDLFDLDDGSGCDDNDDDDDNDNVGLGKRPSNPNLRSISRLFKSNNMSGSALVVQASLALFVLLVWLTVLTNLPLGNFPLFGYHPLLQTLALIALVQAVLVLQPTATAEQKANGLVVHQLLNLFVALPLFTAGAIVMFYLHSRPGTAHFVSWHGTLGTIVVVVAWIQAAFGAASVWFGGAVVGGESKGKVLWKWHRLSGYLLLPLFLLTTFLGATQSNWMVKHSALFVRVLMTLTLGVAVAVSASRVRWRKVAMFSRLV